MPVDSRFLKGVPMVPGVSDYCYHKETVGAINLGHGGVHLELRGFTGTSLNSSMPSDNNE